MSGSSTDSPPAAPPGRFSHSMTTPNGNSHRLALDLLILGGLVILYAALQAVAMLRHIGLHEFSLLLLGAGATFLRVNTALILASLWTIPVGVMIGFHPKLARITQPITQIAASFPAPFLFPIIILGLQWLHLGLGVGAIVLMLLGTQWYILFNVIAGAMAIPSDLREVANLFRFSQIQKWTTVILPGIFPYLITGLVTASGGAWNASIIAEYYSLRGHTLRDCGAGRTDQCSLRSRTIPHPAGGDFNHGNHGGYY